MKSGKNLNLSRTVRFLGIALLSLPLFFPALVRSQETRTVTDSYGREVSIPKTVTRVAPFIPAFCQVTEMLTQGGGKVSAFPSAGISDYFKKVFPDLLKSNPKGYDSNSVEEIIASRAQVAFGPVTTLSDTQREQLKAAGVAVVAANGLATVEELSQSFLIIGAILGEVEAERARKFVQYYQGNVAKAVGLSDRVPPTQRLKVLVLYGFGGGYLTINKKDISHHYLTAAGGINLGADYLLGGGIRGAIDTETIVTWAPEVIFTSGAQDRSEILEDQILAEIPAVKNGRVYACPRGIFVWYARSAEGAMLPLWFGTKLYPEVFREIDMKEVVRTYFADFYRYKIPDDELEAVLNSENPQDKSKERE
jgi:iron complex transport system substrate-binding protein